MNPNQKIKILEIITKSNFGGAQKYVYEMTGGLIQQGFEVVVAFGGSGLLKNKLAQDNVRTITINSLQKRVSFFKDLKTLIELIKIIRREKPDVVHLNSSKIGALGAIATRFFSKSKAIFTIHGLAFKENRNFLSKILILKIYWLTILLANKSIAVSEQVRTDLLKFWFFRLLKNKIVVINNEINKVNFLSKQEARKKLSTILFEKYKINIGENDLVVGSIGELHQIKGFELLIKTCEKIVSVKQNIKFIIIGEGEERSALENLIEDLNIGDTFFLPGYIEDAAKYLKAFDIFVSTSYSEGLPLVILESVQAKIPIICTDVGSNKETLRNYSNKKIIQPKNKIDLYDALSDMIKTIEADENEKVDVNINYKDDVNKHQNKMVSETSKLFYKLLTT